MQTSSDTASGNRNPETAENVVLDCGWGRLLFAQTFEDGDLLLDTLLEEPEGRRDIAFYVSDPHVLLSLRPQQVFLDPSHTYRLDLEDTQELPSGLHRLAHGKPRGRRGGENLLHELGHGQRG